MKSINSQILEKCSFVMKVNNSFTVAQRGTIVDGSIIKGKARCRDNAFYIDNEKVKQILFGGFEVGGKTRKEVTAKENCYAQTFYLAKEDVQIDSLIVMASNIKDIEKLLGALYVNTCGYCGTENSEYVDVCQKCGASLK